MKKTIITLTVLIASIACFSQKEKQDTSTYVLIGKLPDFQLLFKAIATPDDITKNDAKALAAWIQKIQALPDPKPAIKPKDEKPKN